MPIPAQSSTTAPGYPSDVLVGDGHLIVDRHLAAATAFGAFDLLVRSGAYWRPTNADLADSDVWVANTATALGDVVIPATRPVTVVQDTQTLDTGKVTLSGNTGDGTVTATASAAARAGLWRAVCVAEGSNVGTFRLCDPTGADLGAVTVAVETTHGGLTVTIGDGSADWDKGDVLYFLVAPLHAYAATAVAGDTKTATSPEPTWPTNGSTVTDDQVTWTDLGTVDDLRDHALFGVLSYVGDDFTTGAAAHPTMPVILSGQVSKAVVAGLPAAYVAGDMLGLLILES
jgi:hypothetical protein